MDYIADNFWRKPKEIVYVSRGNSLGNGGDWYITRSKGSKPYLHKNGCWGDVMMDDKGKYQYHNTEQEAIDCAKQYGYEIG